MTPLRVLGRPCLDVGVPEPLMSRNIKYTIYTVAITIQERRSAHRLVINPRQLISAEHRVGVTAKQCLAEASVPRSRHQRPPARAYRSVVAWDQARR